MTLAIADRVKETTTTTGTGTLSLGGAVTQFQTFVNGIGSGNQCYYCILAGNGSDWETGIGTVTTGTPATLSRDTILYSSNSNAAVSLTGTSTVFCDAPADMLRKFGANLSTLPPRLAKLPFTTWLNQGSSTIGDNAAGVTLFAPSHASDNISGYYVTAPSTPYSYAMKMAQTDKFLYSDNAAAGIGWYDGTSKIQAIILNRANNSAVAYAININSYSAYNTYNSGQAGSNGPTAPNPVWLKIRDDGTTVYYSASNDGVNFYTLYSVAKSSGYLGSSGYAKPMFLANPVNSDTYATIQEFVVGT